MTRRLLIAVIVAIALGAPIVESFDRWDQTTKDGNDTEANSVIAALCVGAAFAIGTAIVTGRIRSLSLSSAGRVTATRVAIRHVASPLPPPSTSSPPALLRV